MIEKLELIKKRYMELQGRLSQSEVINNQDEYRKLMRELSDIEDIVAKYDELTAVEGELAGAQELIDSGDDEMAEMARAEADELAAKRTQVEEDLKLLLLPKDPNDDRNVMLEIRAGTGGDEAALFGGDLLRMYTRYAETRGYKLEPISVSETEIGGIKECVYSISGKGAYSRFKYESGVHRVQRVPETESGGRIHTSAATVAVLPEAQEVDIKLSPADLRVDVFRAGGHGGQCVNTTDSAVRITHVPTGTVATCQDEKSQLKNKEKAMKVLMTRLYEAQKEAAEAEYASARKSMVGSGDRSERIRTYNFPQNRVTDHRINLTLYKLDNFLLGDMDEMIDALITEDRARALTEVRE